MLKYLLVPVVALSLACMPAFSVLPAHAAVSSWIKAASFVPQSNTDFSSSGFQQSVRNFQAAGGNYVNFIIPLYQSNTGSTDINPGWNTPTDASLISGIQFVHSLGMHAEISIYLETYSGDWRANINPGDRTTWFQRYGDQLVHYGQIAGQQGVELYQLGAELIDMSSSYVNGDNTNQWNTMINRVRGVYGGALTYSANRAQSDQWGDEVDHIGFWNQLSYVGLSAYYELYGDGSVGSLEGDWNNLNSSLISPLQRFGKPIIFTEIGYKSVSGAHNQPWNSGLGGSYDPQEQVNDYTALFDFWNKQSFMNGVVLWWWSPNPNYGGSGNTDYTPQNKPAQDTMKQWWTGGSPNPPPNPPPASGPITVTTSGSANPSAPAVGQATTLTANVQDTNGNGNALVDLEVYSGGTKVFQQYFDNQSFSSGQTRSYNATWTPNTAGTFVLKVGVFASGWSQNYAWNDSAATIQVGSGQSGGGGVPPPPPPSGNAVTDIWWPTNGAHVTGLQPFKAMLENMDVSQYQMYWQVDNGGLMQMANNSADWPHKEALVDLSGWNWKGAGPYTINFVSKDTSGNTISQKSVQIWTQ